MFSCSISHPCGSQVVENRVTTLGKLCAVVLSIGKPVVQLMVVDGRHSFRGPKVISLNVQQMLVIIAMCIVKVKAI